MCICVCVYIYIYIYIYVYIVNGKIARYKHYIAFINTYIRFSVIPRGFQLKFHSNILDLQIAKMLRNCSKKLMFKVFSKYNSNIKRILNDVIYYKNYLNNLRYSSFYLE